MDAEALRFLEHLCNQLYEGACFTPTHPPTHAHKHIHRQTHIQKKGAR